MSQKSQLSYIMDLLNVDGTELAAYLDLDRTLISKWKNNVRPLKQPNKHFEKVIDSLIYFNSQSKNASLERFFGQNYPQEDKNEPEYLQVCLKLWLEGEDSGSFYSLNHWKTPKDALYASKIDIYQGNEGKRQALLAFFNYASTLLPGQEIFISDVEGDLWREEDQTFNIDYHDWINKLANQGHNITLILSEETMINDPSQLVLNRLNSYFTGHITSYSIKFSYPGPKQSMYLIHRQMAVISSCATKDTSSRYINVFKDPFSLKHYVALFIDRMKVSEPLLSNYAIQGKALDNFLNTFENKNTTSNILLSTPELPIYMISSAVLLKILNTSNLSPDKISEVKKIYKQKTSVLLKNIGVKEVEILLSKNAFELMLNSNQTKHHILSNLCGQDIYLSLEDIKESLCCFKSMSKKYPSIHVNLIDFNSIDFLNNITIYLYEDKMMVATQKNTKEYFITSKSKIVLNHVQKRLRNLLMNQEDNHSLVSFCEKFT